MKTLKRQVPDSPPLKGAVAVDQQTRKTVFAWTFVSFDVPTKTAVFQLWEVEYVYDQPPVLTKADTDPHSSNDAGNDGGFQRGATFNRAVSWTMSADGLLTIVFGAAPATGDRVYFNQWAAQMFPKAFGTVPPIIHTLP